MTEMTWVDKTSPASGPELTVDDVFAARRRLLESRHYAEGIPPETGKLDYAERDKLLGFPGLREARHADTYLAVETPEKGRSFKWRGAANLILSMVEAGGHFTPVAASAGNHAQGLALIMNYLGTKGILQQLNVGKAKIYMPIGAPQVKVDAVRRLGGDYVEVVLTGHNFDETNQEVKALVASAPDRYREIPPFNHRQVMAGQGTLALEIIENLLGRTPDDPPLDKEALHAAIRAARLDSRDIEIYVPVGGGGLVAGISTVFKEFLPGAKVIGVNPAYAPAAIASLKAGRQVPLENSPTSQDERGLPVASGITVRQIGDQTLAVMQRNGVPVVTVDNGQIKYVTNWLAQAGQYGENGSLPVPEESGVASLAALINESRQAPASRDLPQNANPIKIAVISGANIDTSVLDSIQAQYGDMRENNSQAGFASLTDGFPYNHDLPRYTPPQAAQAK